MIGSTAPHFSLALEGDPQRRAARRSVSLLHLLLERFFAPSYLSASLVLLPSLTTPSPPNRASPPFPSTSSQPCATSGLSHLPTPPPRTHPIYVLQRGYPPFPPFPGPSQFGISDPFVVDCGRGASCLVPRVCGPSRLFCGFRPWNYDRDKALDFDSASPSLLLPPPSPLPPPPRASDSLLQPDLIVLSSFPKPKKKYPRPSSNPVRVHDPSATMAEVSSTRLYLGNLPRNGEHPRDHADPQSGASRASAWR